jgi:hypothetical protein
VVLADGAKFKGAIDMDKKAGSSASASPSASASSSTRPAMEPVGAGASSKGANL